MKTAIQAEQTEVLIDCEYLGTDYGWLHPMNIKRIETEEAETSNSWLAPSNLLKEADLNK